MKTPTKRYVIRLSWYSCSTQSTFSWHKHEKNSQINQVSHHRSVWRVFSPKFWISYQIWEFLSRWMPLSSTHALCHWRRDSLKRPLGVVTPWFWFQGRWWQAWCISGPVGTPWDRDEPLIDIPDVETLSWVWEIPDICLNNDWHYQINNNQIILNDSHDTMND